MGAKRDRSAYVRGYQAGARDALTLAWSVLERVAPDAVVPAQRLALQRLAQMSLPISWRRPGAPW